VTEDEGNAFAFAVVGEPVPREHALAADDESFPVGFDGVEEGDGRGGDVLFESSDSLIVENVDEEASGVEIDAAVVYVLGLVGSHLVVSLATGRPDPASWLPSHNFG